MSEAVGICVWDHAQGSFMPCPRCGARAKVRHVEPPSGAGDFRHEHRCTRCRHEWEANPRQGQGCTIDECLPSRIDATTAGCLREMGDLNRTLGRSDTWPVAPWSGRRSDAA